MASGAEAEGPTTPKSPAGANHRRAQIIESASRLFDQVGYYPTSMDDIAQAVGIAKPSLYHYFRSKDAILLGIHQEFIALLLSRQAERGKPSDGAVAPQLYEVMLDILNLMHTHRGHVRVFFEHHRELPPEVHDLANQGRDTYFNSVVQLFEVGVDKRQIHGNPRLSAMALFGMCNWAYQWYDPEGPLSPEDVAQSFHDILLNGIAVAASPE